MTNEWVKCCQSSEKMRQKSIIWREITLKSDTEWIKKDQN